MEQKYSKKYKVKLYTTWVNVLIYIPMYPTRCSCLVWLVYQQEKLHQRGLSWTVFSLLWSANAIPSGMGKLSCLVSPHQILRWQEFFAGDLVKALHTVHIRSFSDTKHSIASQRDAIQKLKSCSLRGHWEVNWGSHYCNPHDCGSQYQPAWRAETCPGIHPSKKQ